jgi:hypothetical protein
VTALQPGGKIDAVAHEIVAFDDDVAEIDADAKPHAAGLRARGILSVDCQLDLGGATQRLNRAGKLGDDAVPGTAENPSLVPWDQQVEDLAAGPQGRKRPLLSLPMSRL